MDMKAVLVILAIADGNILCQCRRHAALQVIGDSATRGDCETLEWLSSQVARVQEPLRDMLELALDRISDD